MEETREWGGLVTSVLHPPPHAVRPLLEFLQFAQSLGDDWIATGAEISSHFAVCEAQSSRRDGVDPLPGMRGRIFDTMVTMRDGKRYTFTMNLNRAPKSFR